MNVTLINPRCKKLPETAHREQFTLMIAMAQLFRGHQSNLKEVRPLKLDENISRVVER
jgi:hypothetical protein